MYFRTKAGVLASALLHAAALEDKPMSWLMRAVSGNSESGTKRGRLRRERQLVDVPDSVTSKNK